MSSAHSASLRSADESCHTRPVDAPATWQENCFIMGFDEERDLCIYFHVGRLSDHVETKAAAGRGNTIVWADSHDDAWPEVVVPFEHLRLDWHGQDIGFDLDLRSDLAAIDHAEALVKMGLPGAERDHYESVGRLLGQIELDGATTDFDGVFWRDHTWGAREYARFGTSWWWPTCIDKGRAYVGGAAVELEGRVLGYGLVADDDGVWAARQVEVRVDGAPQPGEYTGVTVEFEPDGHEPVQLRYEPRHHFCTTFAGFNVDRRWNDAFSRCTWGKHRGHGSIELGV